MLHTLRRRWRHPVVSLTLLASMAGGVYSAAPADAADVRSPRIVAAAMQDADGDNRADRLRLTYSERVRHAADRDGRFPFGVTGYRVRAVGRASGRTIVVKLAEQAAPDHEARPSVRYDRTRAQRVTDRARNQAARQAFRATRPHANAPGGPAPTPVRGRRRLPARARRPRRAPRATRTATGRPTRRIAPPEIRPCTRARPTSQTSASSTRTATGSTAP